MRVMEIVSKQEEFSSNCYCMIGNDGSCGIIDPGAPGAEIANICKDNSLNVTHIFLTHGHFDHIGGVNPIKKIFPKAAIVACGEEVDIIEEPDKNLASRFLGTFDKELYIVKADILVKDGDVVELDGEKVRVIETPGHTKGSVCYWVGDDIFTGDTLFYHNYGRTDGYSGNHETILQSLRKFDDIPDHVHVFPGHEQTCTVGDNRAFLESIKR